MTPQRHFVFYFWAVRWDCLSLGLHVCLGQPNVEIHLPFGFIRIGWVKAGPSSFIGRGFGWGL